MEKGKLLVRDTYEGQFNEGVPWEKARIPGRMAMFIQVIGKRGKGMAWEISRLRKTKKIPSFPVYGKMTYTLVPKPKEPEVISKTSIDRYNIYRQGDILNRVLIDFQQNGMRNTGITQTC